MNNVIIKVVIADDNVFFCDALKDSLQNHNNIDVVKTISNLDSLIEFSKTKSFDLLILDVNFNGVNSLDYLDKIKNQKSNFKIIALTTLNNNFIKNKALENGIDTFVGKDTDFNKFKEILTDCYYSSRESIKYNFKKINIKNLIFTKRKIEILQALYKFSDLKEKEISEKLNISENSLKTHKRDLFEITNTNNTIDLIKFGIQNGIIIS